MADITKCKGIEGAELCKDCYRRTAPVTPEWQSWSDYTEFYKKEGSKETCEYYWEGSER
jgi:hypothetical protein